LRLQWRGSLMTRRTKTAQVTYYTTHQIAKMLGVSLATVANWVDSGRLAAHRTPGGHRRVGKADLIGFARAHDYPLSRSVVADESGAVRVLVVDDEPDFTELVSDALSLRGDEFTVETAASGFEAGLAVARFQPSVVLLDLMMPDVDGFEVHRLLMADPATASIPVIACTAFADSSVERRVREQGFSGFLAKPVDLRTLPATLMAVLGVSASDQA